MCRIRSSILLLSLVLVSACGFKSVYANHHNSGFSKVYVNEIPTRSGQVLRSELQDLLASNGENLYSLNVSLQSELRAVGIQDNFRISRYNVVLTADYTLTSNDTGKVVLKDKSIIYSGYDRTVSEFSTFVAEQDATELAAKEAAFEIRSKLATYFSE